MSTDRAGFAATDAMMGGERSWGGWYLVDVYCQEEKRGCRLGAFFSS